MADDFAERIKSVVAKQLGADPATMISEADFLNDLRADSLDTIEIVAALEEEFDCELPEYAREDVHNLADLTDGLRKFFVERNMSVQRLRAVHLAGEQIDTDSDQSASPAERADRKRQLVDGPEMVRSQRVDRDRKQTVAT